MKKKTSYKEIVQKYLILTIALLISATAYNVLISPINLVAGGNNGVAVIVQEIFHIDPSITLFVLCFVLMIISFIFLGLEDTMAALYITLVYPFFIKITSGLASFLPIDTDNVLLITLFAGFVGGITSGIVYKTGLNTGGLGIVSKIFYRKKRISISKVNFIINLIIVIVGGYIFGFNMILYAAFYLYLSRIVSDKLLLGISKNKVFYIISDDYVNITNFLRDKLHHDVTEYDIIGKYSGKKMKMLMTVVPTSEYFVVKEAIASFKSKPFVFVSDSYETKGQDLQIRMLNND